MLTIGPALRMTWKTKLLLYINGVVYWFYRLVNSWTFEHMDKEKINANQQTKEGLK